MVIFTYTLSARTYYVSNTGKDSNAGTTLATAWKTINKVNKSRFFPGDQVLFKRGDMWRGQGVIINWSGTESNPIVFGAYGTGAKPIFNGAVVIKDWRPTGTPNVWVTPNSSGHNEAFRTVVVIDDDRFMPVATLADVNADLEYFPKDSVGKAGDRIYVYSTTNPSTRTAELSTAIIGISDGLSGSPHANITIKDLEFRYYGYAGIDARSNQPDGNFIVDNCTFYHNREFGVHFHNGHENNIAQNCTVSYCGNGLYSNIADNNSFIGNTITNTISYTIGGAGTTDGHAIGIYNSRGVLAESNYIAYGNAALIGLDRADAIIRYNEIHADGTASAPAQCISSHIVNAGDTIDIYYNILFAEAPWGSSLHVYTTNGKANIFNNTIVASVGGSVVQLYYADNVTLKNNILYNIGATKNLLNISYGGSVVSDNNVWFNKRRAATYYVGQIYRTLAAWQTAGKQDLNSIYGDPKVITEATDLRLQPGSPAINAGVNVGLTRDILGNPIVGNPDIGAVEHQNKYTTEDITICQGSAYQGWTATGQYERTLTAASGADSIVTTNLIVNPVVRVSEDINILEGESYKGWTVVGQYERTLTAVTGCDSIVTTNLTVTFKKKYTTEDIMICEGNSYQGWKTAGQYERILTAESGADSIVTTNLIVNPVVRVSEVINILEGENYKGWTEAGQYKRILTAVTGCDSIVTTYLMVALNKYTTEDISICEGSAYQGWKTAGQYERILTAESRADSIVTTNLALNPVYYVSEDIAILEGESYKDWTEAGQYERILTAVTGCDSIVTTSLFVHPYQIQFIAGEGYLVQINQDGVFKIPANYSKSGLILANETKTENFKTTFEGNGSGHMNINIKNLDETGLKVGDEIAAFDGEICVGAVKISESNINNNAVSIQTLVSDNEIINGFTEGKPIELSVFYKNKSAEFQPKSELIEGNMEYQKHGSVFVRFIDRETIRINNLKSIDITMYPNPANEKVMIGFSQLPETGTQIIMTDITGKQLMIHQVQSKQEVLDVSSQPAGMYLVKIISGDRFKVNKLFIN